MAAPDSATPSTHRRVILRRRRLAFHVGELILLGWEIIRVTIRHAGSPNQPHRRILDTMHCCKLRRLLIRFISVVPRHQVQVLVEHTFLSRVRCIILHYPLHIICACNTANHAPSEDLVAIFGSTWGAGELAGFTPLMPQIIILGLG